MLKKISIFLFIAAVACIFYGNRPSFAASCGTGTTWDSQQNMCVADGNSLANEVNGIYGGPNRVTNNAINPAMSGTPMSNVSGQSSFTASNGQTYNVQNSFTAQMQCPASKSFLQILFEPASTQDFTAVISEDPGLTGNWTYTATTPLISGVCQNGFMSCTAGTFSNCQSYNWTINSSGDVSWALDNGSVNLGQCFCTNNSCNANVYNDFTNISDVFGQGLADYVGNALNDAISNVSSSFPTLTYYGQASADCTTVTSQSGSYSNPEQYYQNTGAMSSAAQSQTLTATAPNSSNMASPQSLYYDISTGEYLSQNQTQSESCVIQNIPSVTQVTAYLSYFNFTVIGSGGNVAIGAGGASGVAAQGDACSSTSNTICIAINDTTNAHACGPLILSGGIVYSGSSISGWGQCSGSIPVSGSTGISINGSITCNLDATTGCGSGGANFSGSMGYLYFSGSGQYLYVSGHVSGSITIPTTINSSLSDSLSNGCSSVPSNCKLYTQGICDKSGSNCISTVSGYNNTGITPQENCYNLTGSLDGAQWSVCATGSAINYTGSESPTSGTLATGPNEYWYIKNTYTCPVTQTITANVQRATDVAQNTTATNYTDSDVTSSSYNAGYTGGIQALPAMSSNYPSNFQVQMCEVTTANSLSSGVTANGSAIPNGAMTGTTPNGQGSVANNYQWLTCNNTGTAATPSWVCPATSGETIMQNCEVYNGMNQGITAISTLNSIAQNTICSGS